MTPTASRWDNIVSSEAKAGVVGLGNILMRDEGVGVRVVEMLEARGGFDDVAFYDGGTAILDLMPELTGHQILVVVDALQGGEEPGSVYVLEREALAALEREEPPRTSLHQVSLLEALRMAEVEGITPGRIRILGIEPETVEPGMELSGTLERKLPEVVEVVEREIRSMLAE